MVTINNDNDKNLLIINQINILFDCYKQKLIQKKSLKSKLISYAQTSGFINNIYRKQAWNLLVYSANYQYSTGLEVFCIFYFN